MNTRSAAESRLFPRHGAATTRRLLALCASLSFALAGCGGNGGSGNQDGSTPPTGSNPPGQTLPRGISVLAGATGGPGNADGAVGRLQGPSALAIDREGVLYAGTDDAALRRIAPGANGQMVLGTRWKGSKEITALVADASGNLIAAVERRIVRIAPDGVHTTLAGSDEHGLEDGVGVQARFLAPEALAIDAAGLIWVVDNHRIRTVSAAGEVLTPAAANAVLFDVTGELYGQPMGINQRPTGLAFDHAGNLVIGVNGGAVRKLTPAGARVDMTLTAGDAIAADREGRLYGFDQCTLYRADSAGQTSVLAGAKDRRGAVDGPGAVASFGDAHSCSARIVADGAGNVFVSDYANDIVRKVTVDGVVTTVAGKAEMPGLQDGTGSAARFNWGFHDLRFDGRDSLYLVQEDKVRKMTRAGVVTTLNLPATDAGQNPITYFTGGMAYQGSLVGVANRVVYLVEEDGSMRALAGSPAAGRQADGSGAQAGFEKIRSVTRDGAGNLYLLDSYEYREAPTDVFPQLMENRIRKVTPAGVVTTVYAAPRDNGTRQPWHIVADRQGNVFGSTNDKAVIRITAAGSASFIPVDLQYSPWLALDESGNLFLANYLLLPPIVEKINPAGQAQLIAGRRDQHGLLEGELPGSLGVLYGMTVDDKGVIYVLTENAVVRIVQ